VDTQTNRPSPFRKGKTKREPGKPERNKTGESLKGRNTNFNAESFGGQSISWGGKGGDPGEMHIEGRNMKGCANHPESQSSRKGKGGFR